MKQVLQIVCVGVCVLGSALVVGCGGGDSGSGSTPSGSGSSASSAAPNTNAMAIQGSMIFKKTCATCHNADAKGMPNNGPDLTASAFVRDSTEEELLAYVQVGRLVPGGVPMPPRGGFTEEQLPDSDIQKVIVFLKKFPGNQP